MNSLSLGNGTIVDVCFYQKVNDSKSNGIQGMITNFIMNEFPNIEFKPKSDISSRIQLFISELIGEFGKVWKIDYEKEEKAYYDICDGFESIIMKKLYNKLFSTTKEEKELDYYFEKQTGKYSFVTPQHLEVNCELLNPAYITTAINKLAMINQYKCPKDKISTIINFTNILSSMIINNPSPSKLLYPGADEVLPIVVYTLLKGNIRKLKSNLSYIRLFRHHTRFDSNKEEYFTTVLQSGVEFIERLNVSTGLKIEPDEQDGLLKENELQNKKKLKEYISPEIKNADENYLIYYLTEGSVKQNNNENGSSINSYNKGKPIELIDYKSNAVKLNTASTINKGLMTQDKGLLDIDLDKLCKEYFERDLKDFSIYELEKMINDFKITLKVTEKYIKTINTNAINN